MDPQEMMDAIILKSLKGAYYELINFSNGEGEFKTAKALKRVIKFYSTPTQYEDGKDSL